MKEKKRSKGENTLKTKKKNSPNTNNSVISKKKNV